MAILTKAQLEALNQQSFPDQTTEAITPAILRNYNTQTIDTLVDSLDTGSFTTDAEFNAFTSSTNSSITQLNAETASLNSSASLALVTASFDTGTRNLTFTKGNTTQFSVNIPDASGSAGNFVSTSSFNAYTASTDSSITQLNASSASQQISIDNLNTTTASINSSITQLNVSSASQQISIDALNAATSSYVTSAITASSLITASFSVNTLTFTKGNGDTFGVFIPDVSGSGVPAGTVSSSAQILAYNIFATTGSNTFVGNQTISSSLFISGNISMVNGADLITHHVRAAGSNGLELQNASSGIIVSMGAGGGTQASFTGAVTANSISASSITGIGNVTDYSTSVDSRLDGLEAATSSYVTSAITASSLVTASFSGNTLTFTKGDASTFGVVIPDVSGSTIDTGSFATTGSNVFIGDQTLSDGSGNNSTISSYSGSFVLVAKDITSGSAGLSNITSSANLVNLIFKNNNANSGSLTISGSNNILLSPQAPTAGFRRQVTSNNIFLTNNLPEMTGSLTYSPNISGNYANNVIRLRGPVSSSAWSFSNNIVNANLNIGNADATSANQAIAGGNITTNILLAAVNYNAYTTPLVAQAVFQANLSVGNSTLTAFSSSIAANNNIFVGNTFTVNNRYYGTSSTAAAQRLSLQNNVFGGFGTPTLTAEGSNTSTSSPREAIGNTTNGGGLAIGLVLSGDNSHLYSTLIHGSNLTVTGSNAYNTQASAGSTFIGRNNSVNGTKASSGETIFAVGTGTGTGARKTGFLIDSGSNTFVEGTLNVSGSTTITGSLILSSSNAIELQVIGNSVFTGSVAGNVVSMSITSNTASIDFNLGNYFELTSSVTPLHLNVTNIGAGRTSTLIISASASSSILFSPNVAQPSGSAYSGSLGSIDIISLVSFSTSKVNLVSTKALV